MAGAKAGGGAPVLVSSPESRVRLGKKVLQKIESLARAGAGRADAETGRPACVCGVTEASRWLTRREVDGGRPDRARRVSVLEGGMAAFNVAPRRGADGWQRRALAGAGVTRQLAS